MKPKPKTRTPILDYHEVIDFIETKYEIQTRDYLNKFGEEDHFDMYQRIMNDPMPFGNNIYPDESGKHLGFKNEWTIYRNGKRIEATKEEYEADFKLIHEQYERYNKWCDENPENKPPEYLDYWHWMIEHQWTELHNGSEQYWFLSEILEDEETPAWVKEITQLVYNEFKEHLDEYGGLGVYIEW